MHTAKAHWVNRDTIGWIGAEPSGTYRLYYSEAGKMAARMSDGGLRGAFLPLLVDRGGLSRSVIDKLPFLKGAVALKIFPRDLVRVPDLLKCELVLAKANDEITADATFLQIAGVLDDLFYFDGELGAHLSEGEIRFRLWAPTAQSVRLFIYDHPDDAAKEIY